MHAGTLDTPQRRCQRSTVQLNDSLYDWHPPRPSRLSGSRTTSRFIAMRDCTAMSGIRAASRFVLACPPHQVGVCRASEGSADQTSQAHLSTIKSAIPVGYCTQTSTFTTRAYISYDALSLRAMERRRA